MEKAAVNASNPKAQSGFTMTELVIGSASFVVILTSAIMMLSQWMKATGESDRAIEATDTGARAISQIATDIRMATYLYHYATVSIAANAGQPFANFGTQYLPIVTQSNNNSDLEGRTTADFSAANKGGNDLMGITSTGARNVLAMISDQPYGMSLPRYVVYWVDSSVQNKVVHYKADGSNDDYYLQPLMRLEASPSSTTVDATPKAWYTFADKLTGAATSSLYLDLTGATARLAENAAFTNAVNVGVRITRVADVVMGPNISNIFTLRNPHPYSNASLMSPYMATISIRTTGVSANGYLKRRTEIFELNTQAFARNIPLPQNSAN